MRIFHLVCPSFFINLCLENFFNFLLDSLNYLAAKQLRLAIEKKLSKDSGKQHEASLAPTNDDITSTVPSENYIPSVSNTTSQSGNKSGENRTAEKPQRDFRDSQETKIPKVKYF